MVSLDLSLIRVERVKTGFLIAALWFAISAHAETLTGRVVSVADGDTITILDASNMQRKIRLAGVDAPERKQPYGTASKINMSKLAFDKEATAMCRKKDRYKRDICIVYVGSKDIALAQLDVGLAWVYRKYVGELPPALQAEYLSAEDRAAADREGLWRDADPVPPWKWRRKRK